MTPAQSDCELRRHGGPLPSRDKSIIGLNVMFSAIALTVELYWLTFHQEMESRHDLIAQAFVLYWPADYTYRIPGYPIAKSFTLALEGVNTFLTPLLSFLLIRAILKRLRYRYALQLLIATYTVYGTFLYYLVAHISDYAIFVDRRTSTYVMFYLASLPWLACYAWMAWDAFRRIVRAEQRQA